jgi:small-conductance mechanosensitive channel
MELKKMLEERFQVLNTEYSKQVSEVLKLREALKNAETQVQTIGGQLEELRIMYSKLVEKPEEPVIPKKEVKNVKEPTKE